MKIDDSTKANSNLLVGTNSAHAGKATAKAGGAATSTGASNSASQSDSVHLSSKVQALATSGNEAVFDMKKVEEIKLAIAEGRFQVDPEKVANGLLDTVSSLIHARKG